MSGCLGLVAEWVHFTHLGIIVPRTDLQVYIAFVMNPATKHPKQQNGPYTVNPQS